MDDSEGHYDCFGGGGGVSGKQDSMNAVIAQE
jgi:hypothetical protein